ncbi:MFS transporter [Parvibaculum sp.]|jgi:MFS family permease|uniref:MFS transporter n=1 Tax=Parvibaculum sp. TaxID=2024848 RepID=UPI0032972A78
MTTPARDHTADHRWYMAGLWGYFLAAGIQGVLYPWIIAFVLHESSERVGIAQMFSMLPMLLLGLFGGAMADRVELRRHLMRLQSVAMLPPLILAGLMYNGIVSYNIMILYVLTLSTIGGYVMPARDSMLSRVASTSLDGNIQRAVALAMSGQFLGQVGGYLLGSPAEYIGAWPLLILQSALLGFAAFTTSRLAASPPEPRASQRRSPLRDVKEGLLAVWHDERIRPVLLLMFFSGILFMGVFMVLFPILIRDVYHGSSREIGFVFMSFFGGIGISSLALSRFRPIRRQGRAIMLAMCTGSVVMVLVHFNPPIWGVFLLAHGWGLAAGISMSQSRAIVQESATDALRARMLAGFNLGTMGGGPIGSLLVGILIGRIGPLNAVLIPSGLMLFLWAAIFFFTPLWKIEAPR